MWINNNDDLKRFEKTIDKCEESVKVVTNSGKEYDLKETRGHYLGLARMLESEEYNEPEIFAGNYADQVRLFAYLRGANC